MCVMTGPVAVSFAGELDPGLGGKAGPMSQLELITFGCRLNAYETEVMRGQPPRPGSPTP